MKAKIKQDREYRRQVTIDSTVDTHSASDGCDSKPDFNERLRRKLLEGGSGASGDRNKDATNRAYATWTYRPRQSYDERLRQKLEAEGIVQTKRKNDATKNDNNDKSNRNDSPRGLKLDSGSNAKTNSHGNRNETDTRNKINGKDNLKLKLEQNKIKNNTQKDKGKLKAQVFAANTHQSFEEKLQQRLESKTATKKKKSSKSRRHLTTKRWSSMPMESPATNKMDREDIVDDFERRIEEKINGIGSVASSGETDKMVVHKDVCKMKMSQEQKSSKRVSFSIQEMMMSASDNGEGRLQQHCSSNNNDASMSWSELNPELELAVTKSIGDQPQQQQENCRESKSNSKQQSLSITEMALPEEKDGGRQQQQHPHCKNNDNHDASISWSELNCALDLAVTKSIGEQSQQQKQHQQEQASSSSFSKITMAGIGEEGGAEDNDELFQHRMLRRSLRKSLGKARFQNVIANFMEMEEGEEGMMMMHHSNGKQNIGMDNNTDKNGNNNGNRDAVSRRGRRSLISVENGRNMEKYSNTSLMRSSSSGNLCAGSWECARCSYINEPLGLLVDTNSASLCRVCQKPNSPSGGAAVMKNEQHGTNGDNKALLKASITLEDDYNPISMLTSRRRCSRTYGGFNVDSWSELGDVLMVATIKSWNDHQSQ